MGMTNVLASLGGMLYELPKKAIGYSTLQELDLRSNCEDIGRAKVFFEGAARDIDGDAQTMHTAQRMQEYAINAFDRMETFFQSKHYLQNCGIDPDKVAALSDRGQQLVDTASQFYKEHGIAVPFTPYPILDAIIMMGGMVGASIAFAKYRNKFGSLFPDYSK